MQQVQRVPQVQLSTHPVSGKLVEKPPIQIGNFRIVPFCDANDHTADHFRLGCQDWPPDNTELVDASAIGEEPVAIPAGDRCLCVTRMGNICVFEEMDRAGLAGRSSS